MSPRSRSGDAAGRAEAFFEMDAAEFGSPDVFAIECAMYRDSHETEISMFIEGRNILEFELDGRKHTACWNFDELTSWLRHFLETMEEDPYPAACSSRYAAGKDTESRNFDSDNEEVFDAWYDRLDEWNLRHRWHTASDGAILADVYFELAGDHVEISWNNADADLDPGVKFSEITGGASIDRTLFEDTAGAFLNFYEAYWSSGGKERLL